MRSGTRAGAVLLVLVLLAVAAGCRLIDVSETGESVEEPDLETQIAATLQAASDAWNRGDLEGFMADYERAPTTTYIGIGGLLEGWDAIHDRYAPLFAVGAERDSVRFEAVRVRSLDPRHALVTARYVLHRDGQVTASGPFTLVLLGVEGRWKIIHDHSSRDPPPADSAVAP